MGAAARCRGGREVWILQGGDVLVAPGNQVEHLLQAAPPGKPGGASSTNRQGHFQ